MTDKAHLARATAAVALAATLAGCTTLRSPYVPPQTTVAPSWAHASAATSTTAPASADPWWRRFGDPTLDRLVERVLERNNNRAAAAIAVRQARLQARLAVINPTVSASVNGSREYPLSNSSYSGATSFGGATVGASESATTNLGVSYVVDLFGALGAQRDVARWGAKATEQDLESTTLTLTGTTVNLYYQVAYLNQRVALAEQSIAYAQKTLDLVQTQHGAGSASALDVATAEQQLTSQQANLHDLINQRVAARNAISLLLNGETWDPAGELPRLPDAALPAVDAGLPAQLLARRPDLRAAELRLREQLASADQTRLSFYPSLSLTGSVGTTSLSLSNLIQNPAGTLGAGATLPFLQVNQMRLQVANSRLAYEKAVINFRQTLYQALADVDNALSAREQSAAETALLKVSLKDARLAERLYEVSYRAGSQPLKAWLDQQEARRQAEVSLAQNQLTEINNHVTLCEALGGDATAQR